MDLGLQGKLAVVTGSTSGIGKAIAIKLAEAGAHVVINGRSEATTNAAVADIQVSHPQAHLEGVAGDLSSADGAAAFCAAVDALQKPLDVLVCNAGIFATKDFWDIEDEEWLTTFNINVMSNVRLTRHFLKPMLERNQGRVILIASEAGVRIIPAMLHYSVSKTAQIGLAQGLAQLAKGRSAETEATAYFTENERTSLLQRFLQPDEIAAAVAFLASAAASGINGSAMRVEGGIVRHI